MSVKGFIATTTAMLTMCALVVVAAAKEPKADVQVQTDKGKVAVDVDGKRTRDKKADRRDKSSQGMAHRASEIDGMTVKDHGNKELGTVQDVVIDVRDGKIKYAALSYGGFLGVGDKLFAVPWNAFGHHHDTDSGEHTLILSVKESALKEAPGFDQDKWPNFADPKLSSEIEKYYGKFPKPRDRRDGALKERRTGVDIKAGPVEVEVDVKRDRNQPDRKGKASKDVVHRSSKILGLTVKNTAGKELGSVNDLVIDMDTGKVRYAALSYGGLLGIGDKLFAVPWSAFDYRYDTSDEEYYLVLAVNEATLKKAPGFNQDKWPDLADPKFGDQIDKYYNLKDRRTGRRTLPKRSKAG